MKTNTISSLQAPITNGTLDEESEKEINMGDFSAIGFNINTVAVLIKSRTFTNEICCFLKLVRHSS